MEERLVGDLDAGARWYPEMIRLKTGSLFRAVCHIGALLGGADPLVSAALARYGEHLGTAFQIRDDLLSYLSTPEQTGKPATSDLNNGRPTLPLLLAYDAIGDAARVELLAVLHRRGAGPGDVEWVTALLDDVGRSPVPGGGWWSTPSGPAPNSQCSTRPRARTCSPASRPG
ncbi:polyprenyl synthetase family protein [Micromonospora sp. BRA006-A]|nr:polyprenyl synthetase family protein [Micromonospora sp. BRA006-A]